MSNTVLDWLTRLFASTTLEKLVGNFNGFAAAMQKFHARAATRCDDLLSSFMQSRMIKALTTLKHSMPMLSTAFSLALKYPSNEEAVSAKLFAAQQVEKQINDVVSMIKTRSGELQDNSKPQIGLLANHFQCIESSVSPQRRHSLVTLELETMAQALVQHLMSLSSFVSKSAPRYSRSSNNLVKDCQKLLELVSLLTKLSISHSSSCIGNSNEVYTDSEGSSEFGSVCRIIRGKLKSITKSTHAIVISLFSHVFTITMEPLTELVRVNASTPQNRNSQISSKLKSSIKAFELHYHNILEVTKFIHMCCPQSSVCEDMQINISTFNDVSLQIVDHCLDLSSNSNEHIGERRCHASLVDLSSQWLSSLKSLLHCSISSLDLSQLTCAVQSDITSAFEKCHEDIVNLDDLSLSKHVINATGKAKLLSMIAESVVSASTDPIYRNGVLSHIKQLSDATAHVIASGNLLMEDMARLVSQESFLASASCLKANVGQLCLALFSKSNHPPLTSAERKGLRDFSDPEKISGMIKEMQILNQKLETLGFKPNAPAIDFSKNYDDDKVKSHHQAVCHVVDDMFGTSGPDVNVTEKAAKNENLVRFGCGLHPLASRLLCVSRESSRDLNAINTVMCEMSEMTKLLSDAAIDSESALQSCKLRIAHVQTDPMFVSSEAEATESCGVLDLVVKWTENLVESCNLIEGCVVDEKKECSELLISLCESWSQSCRILLGCYKKVLQVYMTSVKRYISIPESGENDKNKENTTPQQSSETDTQVAVLLEKSPLSMLAKMNESLSILLSDAILLYKRDVNSRRENEMSPAIKTRLDALLSRSKKTSSDLANTRRLLKEKSKKIDSSVPCNSVDVSWQHIYAVVCASKLSALWSIVETTLQMVLGIRKLIFPIDYFLYGDAENLKLLLEYKNKMASLAQSAVDRIHKSLATHQYLGVEEKAKMQKIRNRIELMCGSIKKTLNFFTSQDFSELLISHHGYLISHLLFLHQKFSLEVSRILLIIRALTQADEELKKTTAQFTSRAKDESSEKETEQPALESSPSPKSRAFSDRLAALTQQRKERETDLFRLLSETDVAKQPCLEGDLSPNHEER